jgi:pimeloyl-ACP methyl ester carboxylesterase
MLILMIDSRWFRAALLCGVAALLLDFTGCMDITGRGPAPQAKTVTVAAVDSHPRLGHVYCMRGWLGIFSTGMDALASEIDVEVPAVSVADEEWRHLGHFLVAEHDAGRLPPPVVLLGHSWGADDQIRVAEYLKEHGIRVNLLITIDPVTPPTIPDNVDRCVNIYKSHPMSDVVPLWRGVEIDPKSTSVPVFNYNLRVDNVGFPTDDIDHINIEKSIGVHQMCIREIEKTCPLRQPVIVAHPALHGPALGAATTNPAALLDVKSRAAYTVPDDGGRPMVP